MIVWTPWELSKVPAGPYYHRPHFTAPGATAVNVVVTLSSFSPGIPGVCAGPGPGFLRQPCGSSRRPGPGDKRPAQPLPQPGNWVGCLEGEVTGQPQAPIFGRFWGALGQKERERVLLVESPALVKAWRWDHVEGKPARALWRPVSSSWRRLAWWSCGHCCGDPKGQVAPWRRWQKPCAVPGAQQAGTRPVT